MPDNRPPNPSEQSFPADDGPQLPDRIEDLPGWREPPKAPEIPEQLRRPVARPESLRPTHASQGSRDAQQMGWVYATSMAFVGGVAVFTVAGYFLDKWLGTAPWLLISGLGIGLVGGTIKFVVDGLRANRDSVAATKARHPVWREVEPESGGASPGETEQT